MGSQLKHAFDGPKSIEMDTITKLSPFQSAPAHLKAFYKYCQDLTPKTVDEDDNILDFTRGVDRRQHSIAADLHPRRPLSQVYDSFLRENNLSSKSIVHEGYAQVFTSENIPGLLILPGLLPDTIQKELLSRMLHRDLSDPRHQTNLHLHYNVKYPNNEASFFSMPKQTALFEPKNPSVHKPLKTEQVLNKKLRWITLGGQYDWTNKKYPAEVPPNFPQDIRDLISEIFDQKMEPQAAIINIYSPGDTLSLHRDVSEESSQPLVSISLGCDCIFLAGLDGKYDPNSSWAEQEQVVALRLRSGDALFMGGESRYAWHGVPKIIPGTSPTYLAGFPEEVNTEWQGYMDNKRINLNIRQMWD